MFYSPSITGMAAGPRGQQPGMTTLRPSVGERSHNGTPSQEKSVLRVESRNHDYEDTNIETRVSRESEIREGFRGGRRKCGGPIEFRALECTIREACRISHQLGAIRSPYGDSDHWGSRKDQRPAFVLWRANEEHGPKNAGR